MGWSIVQDQSQCMDAPPQCLGDDHRQQKDLVVDESFAVPTHTVDPPISHTQTSGELQSSLAFVARRDMNRMPYLLKKDGKPTFQVNFYAVDVKGRIGGAAIYPTRFGAGDQKGARLEDSATLYESW